MDRPRADLVDPLLVVTHPLKRSDLAELLSRSSLISGDSPWLLNLCRYRLADPAILPSIKAGPPLSPARSGLPLSDTGIDDPMSRPNASCAAVPLSRIHDQLGLRAGDHAYLAPSTALSASPPPVVSNRFRATCFCAASPSGAADGRPPRRRSGRNR